MPTIDGSAEVKVKPGTQPNDRLRMRGYGVRMDVVGQRGRRGDQYVRVVVKVPRTLTPHQRRLLEDFRSGGSNSSTSSSSSSSRGSGGGGGSGSGSSGSSSGGSGSSGSKSGGSGGNTGSREGSSDTGAASGGGGSSGSKESGSGGSGKESASSGEEKPKKRSWFNFGQKFGQKD